MEQQSISVSNIKYPPLHDSTQLKGKDSGSVEGNYDLVVYNGGRAFSQSPPINLKLKQKLVFPYGRCDYRLRPQRS